MAQTRIGAAAALEALRAQTGSTQDDWTAAPGRDAIFRRFVFADFKEAFAFMTAAALKAEQMDHHPEWFNVYRTVDVTLATHDADGVTALDVELAAFMDRAAARRGPG